MFGGASKPASYAEAYVQRAYRHGVSVRCFLLCTNIFALDCINVRALTASEEALLRQPDYVSWRR